MFKDKKAAKWKYASRVQGDLQTDFDYRQHPSVFLDGNLLKDGILSRRYQVYSSSVFL